MPRRLTPIEDTPAWDIYRELLRYVYEHRCFPSEHGLWRAVVKPSGTCDTIGKYRYYVKRLILEGYASLDSDSGSLVPRGVTFSFSQEFMDLLPEDATRPADAPPPVEYVYVLSDSNGLYKIGVSNDPARRLRDMAVQHPDRLAIVHKIATRFPFLLERELHRHFARKQVQGEWFSLDSCDLAYLRKAGDHLLSRQQVLWVEPRSRKRHA